MTVLKTVEDVGATLAWYPGSKAMVALGTTEASGAGTQLPEKGEGPPPSDGEGGAAAAVVISTLIARRIR